MSATITMRPSVKEIREKIRHRLNLEDDVCPKPLMEAVPVQFTLHVMIPSEEDLIEPLGDQSVFKGPWIKVQDPWAQDLSTQDLSTQDLSTQDDAWVIEPVSAPVMIRSLASTTKFIPCNRPDGTIQYCEVPYDYDISAYTQPENDDIVHLYYYEGDNQIHMQYPRSFLIYYMNQSKDTWAPTVYKLPINRWMLCENLTLLNNFTSFVFINPINQYDNVYGDLCCYTEQQLTTFSGPGLRLPFML